MKIKRLVNPTALLMVYLILALVSRFFDDDAYNRGLTVGALMGALGMSVFVLKEKLKPTGGEAHD